MNKLSKVKKLNDSVFSLEKLGLLYTSILFFSSVSYGQSILIDSPKKSTNLDEVIIESRYYKAYNTKKISSDLRLQTSLMQTPQNIQIVNADILKDQMVLNVNDGATRNVSGTIREELHNAISPDIFSRGGYINAQRNGVDLRPIVKGPVGDDASIIENIEFIKGPSGFMNAMSDPAGSYNIVTKKPTGITRNTVKMMFGSFNTMRAEGDFQGLVDDNEKLAFRFNLMGMKSDGFLKYSGSDKIIMAPSFKYKINDKSALTLEFIYQHFESMLLSEAQMSPYGYGSLPGDFSISDPSIRPYRGNDYNAFLTWDQVINNDWKVTTRISNINNEYNGSILWAYAKNEINTDLLDRYLVYDAMYYNVFFAQNYIQGKFKIGNVSNTFLAGIDFNNKFNGSTDTWGTAETIYQLDLSNPQYANAILNNGIGGNFETENGITAENNKTRGTLHYVSAYAMNTSTFFNNKLFVNYGFRATKAQGKFTQYGENTNADDFEITPRIGITYMPDKSLSFYGLYDRSFLPQLGIAFDGSNLKPQTGQSFELGIKKDWASGMWNTTLYVYTIDRNSILTKDIASNKIYQSGENRSKGIEFDLKGRIAPGLNVLVNYAYTDSKITKDEVNPSMLGMATPNRVRHVQNTWINYQLPFTKLNRFSIGAGYQYLAGRTERFSTDKPEDLKDIFKMDTGITYTGKNFTVQLMANNLLNAKIYSTAWKKSDMYYWVQQAPRSIRCLLTMNL